MRSFFFLFFYLFNTREIKLKPGVNPRKNFIPPHKVCTIHHPYIRCHYCNKFLFIDVKYLSIKKLRSTLYNSSPILSRFIHAQCICTAFFLVDFFLLYREVEIERRKQESEKFSPFAIQIFLVLSLFFVVKFN